MLTVVIEIWSMGDPDWAITRKKHQFLLEALELLYGSCSCCSVFFCLIHPPRSNGWCVGQVVSTITDHWKWNFPSQSSTFWRGTDIGIPGGIIIGAIVLTCWIIILAMICHCGWIYGRVKLKIEQAREDPNGPPSYLYALRTQRRQDEEFNGEFGEADGCTQ